MTIRGRIEEFVAGKRTAVARAGTTALARGRFRVRGTAHAGESRPVDPPEPAACIQRAYYLEARKGFPTDAALAEAMGVSRSQVSRWSQGKPAQRENGWLLRDLATAVARLADHYEPSTIYRWLYGSNPDLDGEPPLDALRQGRLPEVLMAIEAQTSGAFG